MDAANGQGTPAPSARTTTATWPTARTPNASPTPLEQGRPRYGEVGDRQGNSSPSRAAAITYLAGSPDGKRLACVSFGETLEGMGRGNRQGTPHPQGTHGIGSRACGLQPGRAGNRLAAPPRMTRRVKCVDAADRRGAALAEGHRRSQQCGLQPPDGHRLASGANDSVNGGTVKIWDAVAAAGEAVRREPTEPENRL